MSNVRSQPDIRGQQSRPTVRSALASAAALGPGEHDYDEEEPRPRGSMQLHTASPSGPRHPRSRMMSSESSGYPDMDDLVPPARVWETGSVYSRNSIDSRRAGPASPRKGLFGSKSRAPQQEPPQSPASERRVGFGLFSNRSTPSLHRAPAPEDPDYEWSKRNRAAKSSKKQQREWHSTTPRDYHRTAGAEHSQWEPEEGTKKAGFLSRMFGRKK